MGSRPKTAAGSRKAAAAVSCVVMPMLLCKLDELPPLLVRFFAHQTRAGPTGDPASRPRSTAGPKRAAAAVSCTVMLRLFCELGMFAAFRAFFAHQNGAGPLVDPASQPRTAPESRKAAAAVSCVLMLGTHWTQPPFRAYNADTSWQDLFSPTLFACLQTSSSQSGRRSQL
jgi:hypothetical protein